MVASSPGPSSDALERARRVARTWAAEHGFADALAPFDARVERGQQAGVPVVHLEDVSGIPFVSSIPGVEEYQHRARVRARTGDLFAAVTEPVRGYEAYNRERLELGAPERLQPEPVDGDPMRVAAACRRGAAFDRLVELGKQCGGLVVHPYMAIEDVWALAADLIEAGVSATVLGPPPPVLWTANDKSTLAHLVDRIADGAWNVETRRGDSAEAMADALRELAERHHRVGLKRTRCASAMGNIVFEGPMVRQAAPSAVLAEVERFLGKTEWEPGEEVLVVEWADNDHSPSTQLWIPPRTVGQPVLQGVYQQLLDGPERVFVGSRPSTLPEPVNAALADASMQMAACFQELGYVGRCSFDFIVTGDAEGDFGVRMTECNGRWGGTSTPMHLVDRLTAQADPHAPRPHYIAQDYVHPDLVGRPFGDILDAVGDALYEPRTGQGRFVFYNAGPLAKKGKIDVISLGATPDEAMEGVEVVLPRLLGLP